MTETDRPPPTISVVDGVRVLHHELPYGTEDDFTSAVLSFAVGSADESLPMLGVGHLVEHLSIWPVRHTALDIDGSAELQSTTFTAHGRPDEAAGFLTQICSALSALPTEQIRHESGVLEAEDASGVHPLIAILFNLRFGNQGPGLLALAEPDPAEFTGSAVQSFANHWFVPANAFVQIIGRLPATLSFPLHVGQQPTRTSFVPTPPSGPAAAFDEAFEAVGLIIDFPLDDERGLAALCLAVLERRLLEEARFVGGFSYSIQRETFRVSATLSSTGFALDARPGVWKNVAECVIRSILALASVGPTAVELELAIETERQRRLTPLAGPERAWLDTLHELRGWPPGRDPSRGETVTAADLATMFTQALSSVIVCGPPEAADAKPQHWTDATERTEVASLPHGQRFRPGAFAQMFSSTARKASVLLSADGVGQELEGSTYFIPWREVIGVIDDSEEHIMVIHAANGTTIDVGDHYRRGREILQTVRKNVDPTLFYPPWHRESDVDPAG